MKSDKSRRNRVAIALGVVAVCCLVLLNRRINPVPEVRTAQAEVIPPPLPGQKTYKSSGRRQPDPIIEPDEAQKYLADLTKRYKSYWELPEDDQRFVRGLASGHGETLFQATRIRLGKRMP
jgi:hypothetical protein